MEGPEVLASFLKGRAEKIKLLRAINVKGEVKFKSGAEQFCLPQELFCSLCLNIFCLVTAIKIDITEVKKHCLVKIFAISKQTEGL